MSKNFWILGFIILCIRPATSETLTTPERIFGLGEVNDAEYSADGSTIAIAGNRAIHLYQNQTNVKLNTLISDVNPVLLNLLVREVAISADASLAAAAYSNNVAVIWNAATGQILHTLTGHTDGVVAVDFSPDASLLATGSEDRSIKIWDVQTGVEVRTLSGHTGAINQIDFSQDGTKLASCALDLAAKVWDASTGAILHEFSELYIITDVSFSPDGSQILTAGINFTDGVKLWDSANYTEILTCSPTLSTSRAAFSSDGSRIVANPGVGNIILFDATTGEQIRNYPDQSNSIRSLAISPDGTQILSTDFDNEALVWNLETTVLERTYRDHIASIRSVAFSPDGSQILTGSVDDDAFLWGTATGTNLQVYIDNEFGDVNSVSFSPDGNTLLIAAGQCKTYNKVTGAEIQTFFGDHSASVIAAAFSPSGDRVLTGSLDNAAKLFTTADASQLQTFTGSRGQISSVAFTPDGSQVIAGSFDGATRLYNISDGMPLRVFGEDTSSSRTGRILARAISVSPDGKQLLTGWSNGEVHLWNIDDDSAPIRTWSLTTSVSSVAFSPDSRFVLGTTSLSNTAVLWEKETGDEVRRYAGQTANLYACKFSPDGQYILTAGDDHTAFLWPAPPPESKSNIQNWNLYSGVQNLQGKYRSLVLAARGL